jgi:hypothetical protein
MAGLVPAIHVSLADTKGVDARHKAGHDAEWLGRAARYFRSSSAIKLDVSQRLPPMACTSE